MKKGIIAVAGATGLLASSIAAANGLSLDQLIQTGQTLPQIESILDDGPSALNSNSGTVTLNDGSKLVFSAPEGTSTLNQALSGDSGTVLVNGNPVAVSTSASSLGSAYNNGDQTSTFTVSALVEGRPVTLEWEGPLEAVNTASTLNATLNGQPITLQLPEGTTLADFNGDTPITLLDGDGNVLFSGQLDSLTRDEALALAAELGALNVDQALRGAQKQALAQNFNPIIRQIDSAMFPSAEGHYSRPEGTNLWASTEISDLDGDVANSSYSGDGKVALLGIDFKHRNVLVGIAAGNSEMDLDHNGSGRTDLGGEMISPYGAVSFLDGTIVLDAIVMYQELDGSIRGDYLAEPIDLDGDRWAARGSGTYFLPEYHSVRTGLTVGGAYMEDDLDGKYIGATNDYGVELGEVFGGVKFGADFFTGEVYGSLLYHYDVSSDVNSDADYLDDEEGDRTVLELGAAHRLGTNMDFGVAGRTTLGSSSTEYDSINATLSYNF